MAPTLAPTIVPPFLPAIAPACGHAPVLPPLGPCGCGQPLPTLSPVQSILPAYDFAALPTLPSTFAPTIAPLSLLQNPCGPVVAPPFSNVVLPAASPYDVVIPSIPDVLLPPAPLVPAPCGCQGLPLAAPTALVNPFLPAASPVSALAPTVSSLLPPAAPCGCGSLYLRKIPIPPPYL